MRAPALWSGFRASLTEPMTRNAISLVLNSGITSGSGFLFWFLLARRAPAGSIGAASALVGAVTLLAMLAKIGLDTTILETGPGMGRAERRRMLWRYSAIAAALGIFGSLIFTLGAAVWAPGLLGQTTRGSLLALLTFLVTAFATSMLLDAYLLASGRAGLMLAKTAVHAALKVLAAAFLPSPEATGIAIALLGTSVLALALVAPFWKRARSAPAVGRVVSTLGWTATAANFAVAVLLTTPGALGPLIVLERQGADAAALFFVMWMVGALAMLAPTSFGQAAIVELSRTGHIAKNSRLRAVALCTTAAAGILVVALIMLPLLGAPYTEIRPVSLLPFVLAAVPGYYFQTRLAYLRIGPSRVRLVFSAAAFVGVFTIGSAFASSVTAIGWIWLIAQACGLAASVGRSRDDS